jgi:uncharacterized repeat protein (TIGR01451 family)
MGSDLCRRGAHRRALLATGSLVIGLLVGCFMFGTPSFAATSADLSATLTNKTAVPGHRVSYVVQVTNHGPSPAQKVQFDFFTSSSMSSVQWSNPTGRCIRSAKETACLFGTLKAGQSAKATISGVISKSLKKGTAVNNRVVLGSDTHLTNTANDTVADNFRIGIATVVPPPAPSPTPSVETKIEKITHVASDTIAATNTALIWSLVALGAAALWFAVGLTLRARKRRNNPRPEYD